MHSNDAKYGFMKEWALQLTPQSNYTPEAWLKQGLRAWDLLQDLPEGQMPPRIIQDEFKFSPEN